MINLESETNCTFREEYDRSIQFHGIKSKFSFFICSFPLLLDFNNENQRSNLESKRYFPKFSAFVEFYYFDLHFHS